MNKAVVIVRGELMRRVALLLLWGLGLVLSVGLVSSLRAEDPDGNESGRQLKEAESKWQKDSETLLGLVRELRSFREGSNDSDVQKKAKARKLEAAILSLNKRLAGTELSLSAVRLVEVKAERVLNEVGKQKARELVGLMRKDPSAAAIIGNGSLEDNPMLQWTIMLQLVFLCNDKCYSETGRFEAEYVVPQPAHPAAVVYQSGANGIRAGEIERNETATIIGVTIIRIVKNEDEALNLKKGEIKGLRGKIRSLMYRGDAYSESVKIVVE